MNLNLILSYPFEYFSTLCIYNSKYTTSEIVYTDTINKIESQNIRKCLIYDYTKDTIDAIGDSDIYMFTYKHIFDLNKLEPNISNDKAYLAVMFTLTSTIIIPFKLYGTEGFKLIKVLFNILLSAQKDTYLVSDIDRQFLTTLYETYKGNFNPVRANNIFKLYIKWVNKTSSVPLDPYLDYINKAENKYIEIDKDERINIVTTPKEINYILITVTKDKLKALFNINTNIYKSVSLKLREHGYNLTDGPRLNDSTTSHIYELVNNSQNTEDIIKILNGGSIFESINKAVQNTQ